MIWQLSGKAMPLGLYFQRVPFQGQGDSFSFPGHLQPGASQVVELKSWLRHLGARGVHCGSVVTAQGSEPLGCKISDVSGWPRWVALRFVLPGFPLLKRRKTRECPFFLMATGILGETKRKISQLGPPPIFTETYLVNSL